MSYRFAIREIDKYDIFCQLTMDFTRGTKHELIDSRQISIRAGWGLGGPRVAQGPNGAKAFVSCGAIQKHGRGVPHAAIGYLGFIRQKREK